MSNAGNPDLEQVDSAQVSLAQVGWAQVDVFAERSLEGNMLAIFPDAGGLSDTQMQALARETNLSETTFILPGDAGEEREHGVHVRIFTPQEELPFAGHPTLGTASWLRLYAPTFAGADEVKLRLRAGTIPVRFRPVRAGERGVYGTMRQLDPTFGALPDPVALTAALGIRGDDLHPTLRPQVVSTGLPFAVVPLRDTEALGRLAVDAEAVTRALSHSGSTMAYCIAPAGSDAGSEVHWRARMRFYAGEDPATGSAAGCAISYLVRQRAVPPGAITVIAQGVEMLRPSRLVVSAQLDGERVHGVEVGGRTIPVAVGRFILD